MVRSEPSVLLLDDGELDDVQELLQELGVECARVRGSTLVDETPIPRDLLIATPRRVGGVQGEEGPLRIVVVNEDSVTLRDQLRAIGFDYLVRRPVHREALKLLLMHCLYKGEERRREPRIPVGYEVSFRSGLLPRRSTLADLSIGGCRLISRYAIEPGRRIKITIPVQLGATEPLTVSGLVLRMSFDERLGEEGLYTAAVQFEGLTSEARQELEWILQEHAKGPVTLSENEAAEPGAAEVGLAYGGLPEGAPRREALPNLRRVRFQVDVRLSNAQALAASEPEPPVEARPPEPPVEARPPEPTPAARASGRTPALEASPSDRRKRHRGAFERKVPAFGSRALRVLVGRDLSTGGMRVEGLSELELGDRLHLAIYGDPGEEPFLVWGTVSRDDGAGGMALVFDEIHPSIGQRLERLVAGLPAVESLDDAESAAMGTVVSEILES
jgi:hypothetical protein